MTTAENAPIFEHTYRIYLEDTDAGGIVYHANHLKLFERCRRDWLRSLGMTSYFYAQHTVQAGDTADIHFVVSDVSIRYFQPILLDSLVTVTVTTCQPKSASLMLRQEIFDNTFANNKNLLAVADITLVCVQSVLTATGKTQLRPARLPKPFLEMIR